MFARVVLLGLAVACLMPATAAENDSEKTRRLVATLQSNAAFFDKARACQQLGEFGDRQAVPALAALLGDEHLSAYARSGLEGIPDPSAAEALRSATSRLKGKLLAGVVNSLGVLRDGQAVGVLKTLANDPASGVTREALLALGRIATEEAVEAVRSALSKESEMTRSDAASACLLAAERQAADGRVEAAAALYDAVRVAAVPLRYRVAATRGAIVVRKANGIPLLVEQLRSNELAVRNAALLAIREISSDAVAGALNAEIGRAPKDLQIQLLTVLGDCHNAQSISVLRDKAASEDDEVRKTALSVLGRIGDAAAASALLKAVTDHRNADDSAIAADSLKRMEGPVIDAQIIQALAAGSGVGGRVALIRLLETRGATNAATELLRQAADPDAKVSVAALRALKSLASPGDVPALVALTRACRDESVREAAENAVVGACAKGNGSGLGTDVVLAELKQAADPATKSSWVRILVSLGQAKALPAIMAASIDADEKVAANAIEQLARWPDPSPIDDLFAAAHKAANPAQRKRALTSAIRLATTAAEENQRPPQTLVKWFERAGQLAQATEDRRLIISGLGRVSHPESLRLLAPHLDTQPLRDEAAVAIIRIAPALRRSDPGPTREALEKVVATVKNADLRHQAEKLAGAIPKPAARTRLFDSQSLAGWEGNTNVWRVRNGVIVGGSLAGNPRNEFLATVGRYSNFVLRLEYKLVGTSGFVNGGVQFRSERVKQPANEMCGFQADIGAGYSGCLYDESRRNKNLVRAPEELIKRLEKPGEWNRYEVRCAGPRMQILLNGEKTVDYVETDAAIPQDGVIGLQIHGDNKAEISFRSLTIEDLSYGTAIREFALAKTSWKVLSFSSENTQAEDERAVLAIDGNPDTFWHTRWNGGAPKHPHHLAGDMVQEAEITGFAYLPRQDGRHVKGVIGEFEFYVSQDGREWGQPVARGRFDKIDQDASGRVVLLSRPVTGRYFKLVSLSAPGNEPYAGAAEIDVLGKPRAR